MDFLRRATRQSYTYEPANKYTLVPLGIVTAWALISCVLTRHQRLERMVDHLSIYPRCRGHSRQADNHLKRTEEMALHDF